MRETVAPGKLLNRRKITTVPAVYPTGAQPWIGEKQWFASTMWDPRNIPETYPPARYRFSKSLVAHRFDFHRPPGTDGTPLQSIRLGAKGVQALTPNPCKST